MYPQCLEQNLVHSRCPINICWINEWVFFNWIIRVNRSQFKPSKQRKTFHKKQKVLPLRTWISLTLEEIFITFGFLYRVILITVITWHYSTENLQILFFLILEPLPPTFSFFFVTVLEKKLTPSVPFLIKNTILTTQIQVAASSIVIYSASSILLLKTFYILYSYWTIGSFWKICVLAIKPFCKQ